MPNQDLKYQRLMCSLLVFFLFLLRTSTAKVDKEKIVSWSCFFSLKFTFPLFPESSNVSFFPLFICLSPGKVLNGRADRWIDGVIQTPVHAKTVDEENEGKRAMIEDKVG